ncbi:MAG TPA: SpoIIE family protein phosphatase [Aquihabitans sp.]|jgi:GAF domain-containing protein|nr:SpoIIE family protein phosphatase [Aquihabitans sp.]
MTGPEPDLDLDRLLAECAKEPIHAPGAVQPHGCLLGLDEQRRVVVASENCEAVLGVTAADLLGRPLSATLGAAWDDVERPTDPHGISAVTDGDRGSFECVVVPGGSGMALLEVEPTPAVQRDDHWRLYRALHDFHGAESIDAVLEQAVHTVRELAGFDRVMLYRFDEEWNGEVVAEARGEDVDSFLGLRFPATDIPPQARALYARSPVRVIPDACADASPLVALDAATAAELDLSDVSIRAVSPIHLRYLRNMGVDASMSAAITVRGRLWGLVACHHLRGSHRPGRRVRNAVDLVARTTSTVVTVLLDAEATGRRLAVLAGLDGLTEVLRADERRPEDLVETHGGAILELFDASGAMLLTELGRHAVGAVPPTPLVEAIVAAATDAGTTEVVSDELRAVDPRCARHAAVAAGLVLVRIGPYEDRWLALFRPELAETVRWGGDPQAKSAVADDSGAVVLDPRASFAEYVEQVGGRCRPWTPEEVKGAHDLARRIGDAYAARTAQEAQVAVRLQEALMFDTLPPIPGFDAAARYRPDELQPLGGDWYDVFFRPDGGAVVVLGDVAGHGFGVAGTMAQLRHALRAYLVRAPDLAEAVERLNELTRTLLPGDLATLVVAEVDARRQKACIVAAGHLPPVLSSPEGARLVEVRGPALGVAATPRYEMTEVPLAPGQSLVLYTDGLIERRSRSLDASLDHLLAVARSVATLPASAQCERLVDQLLDGQVQRDDVTLLVVRPDGGAPPVAGRT